ncbi:helix-turn-helix transcriptional regulator [Actinomadura sp. NPDC047616]|uniref:helix-turn-helix domain-containing protein n=1 Tax=Actinomadura sp. NPDC047616 TaxID=3155914 RepID=UPI0033EC0CA6
MISEPGWDAVLRRDRYELCCKRAGLETEADQARAIGVSASYLNRLLSGERHLNRFFIAGALRTFGCAFEDLFEVRPRRQEAA